MNLRNKKLYLIHLGVPEVQEFWNSLKQKNKNNTASKTEQTLYKKIGKAMFFLSENPRYPGLNTHDIEALSNRYGMKVWESYIENNKPAAGRIFWVYAPNKMDITIIGFEPHPNDKKDSYKKITLSAVQNTKEQK